MKLVKAPKTKRASTQNLGKKNPVAKHASSFNKAQVHTDRKKAAKCGYTKFRADYKNQDHSKAA